MDSDIDHLSVCVSLLYIQMMYPDTISVEKITHMDRLEMDDLDPRLPPERAADSSVVPPAASMPVDDTVSPQVCAPLSLTSILSATPHHH